MKPLHLLWAAALFTVTSFSSCQDNAPAPADDDPTTPTTPTTPTNPTVPSTPATAIPDALVGTWYVDNNPRPMTTNWTQGTFQGDQGFAEFRTIVLTKDGKEAVDYSSEVFNLSDGEVEKRMYKMTGTLVYDASTTPATLTFHAQRGVVRVFSSKYTGFRESPIVASDVLKHTLVWSKPEATTFANTQNFLTAKRISGSLAVAVKFLQVEGTGLTNPAPANDLYTTPPTMGTYVRIGSQYYPTVTIGSQEWMSVNYAGSGGVSDDNKPSFGTYYKFMDLNSIPVPAGWRIPTTRDYVKLLASQGLELNMWGSTDPEDVPSKRKLGQLMAPKVWAKQDGYATNTSGFSAVPSDFRGKDGPGNGIGTNCRLWTSDRDERDIPQGFQIIQLVGDTYASIQGYPIGSLPLYMPVRLVRDK